MIGLASDFLVDQLLECESESPEPHATLVLSHFYGDQPMSSSITAAAAPVAVAAPPTIYLGLDVHKESITVAVLPVGAPAPTRVEKLSSDFNESIGGSRHSP